MSLRSSKRAPRRRAAAIGLLAAFSFVLPQYFAPPARAQRAAEPPASAVQVPDTPLFFAPSPHSPGPPAPTFTAPAPAARARASAPSSLPADSGSTPAPAAPSDDIRDIRGPKDSFPIWLAVALAAAALLLAIAGFSVWRARRRAPRALLPFEIALKRLDEIRSLMRPSSVEEFSVAISDIVRRYIEDEFKITATHLTTEEFLHGLLESSNAALSAHRNLLAHFLEQCDVAKFAGVSLSSRIMETLHQSARTFVIETSKNAAAAETRSLEVAPLARGA
jgi:hypothetical protein